MDCSIFQKHAARNMECDYFTYLTKRLRVPPCTLVHLRVPVQTLRQLTDATLSNLDYRIRMAL